MAARAAACGVKRIVVTPHVGRAFGGVERPARDVPQATAALQREIDTQGIAVELVPGAEVMLSVPELPARAKAEPWLTVGGAKRYMLVEAPADAWSARADEILFELALCGITPIIAHPERLSDVQKDFRIMKRVVERGALLQVTARSLITPNRLVRQCCHRLLSAGLVSFVASDAHRAEHIWPTEVADALQQAVGDEAASQILQDNPRDALAGKKIAPMRVAPSRKRYWFLPFLQV
jgi:protein-tyrosine phosphatase